jgi:M6 family metalloprotease-like protein
MRRNLFLLFYWGVTICAMAVPARPVSKTVCMVDGTRQEVILRGDESFHFYTTPEGQPVRQNEMGLWELDTRDISSHWTQARARRFTLRNKKLSRLHSGEGAQNAANRGEAALTTNHRSKAFTTGLKRGLLVLVNFRDVRMKLTSRIDIFKQIMNGIGNPYGKNNGSVREYFRAQSYGQFDVEFDVVGPVDLSQNMEYYGADSGGAGEDVRPAHMVKEALTAIDEEVDFSLYDWDGDGEVENVFFIYAGYSQAQGAPSKTIWPHQWTLSEALGSTMTLDGVVIDTYACSSELAGITGSTIDGIGTMCHEYSHCLGLPDFYDTSTNGNFGMSVWSVLDSGCYNNNGYCPSAYTAYERWYCGWLEPQQLDSACTVSALRNIEDHAEAYIIYHDSNPDEYYLLANHQQTGWDKYAYGHGMMILHVDYSQEAWSENTVNTVKNHQRMTIIPADNALTQWSTSLKGDLWPGSAGKHNLTDETTPPARVFTPNNDGTHLLHKPIYGIMETDSIISFRFMQEETDGVQAVTLPHPTHSTTAFDLTGRRHDLRHARPGIYVTQGRKVFIP